MTGSVDLNPNHLGTVKAILAEHVPECEVRAFGSRATWTAKDYSDLDLAVVGEGPLDWRTLDRLKEAFEESDLPMRVDVLDWHNTSESFREVIEREYEVLQQGPVEPTVRTEQSTMTLDDVVDIVMGQSPPGDTVSPDDGVALLNGPTEFGAHHPTPAQYTTDARKLAQAGDLLFCVRGSTTGRMNWADQEYAIGRGVAAIRHRHDLSLQPFVRGVIEVELPELLTRATGSTFPNVSARQLAEIPYPSLSETEQRAIAHVLGTLDDKIELNRRMNETLEGMARALFKSWFVDFEPVRAKMEGRWRRGESLPGLPAELYDLFPGRLVGSEVGEVPEVPEGWEVKALGDVIEIHDRRRVPLNGRQRANRQGPYPYYGAASIMDYVDDFLFDGVYVLTGEDGSVVDAGGHPVVQYAWGKFWVNNHAHVLRGRGGISEEHLYLLLEQVNILAFVTGAVQPKLSQKNLRAVPIVFPSRSVRKAFANLIGPLFEELRSNVDETELLTIQRDALLPKLVTGEVRAVWWGRESEASRYMVRSE